MTFLEQLKLTPDERAGLKSLGPSNPLTLAHMIRASRPAFEQMIGDPARAAQIEQQLHGLLTPVERAELDAASPPPRFSLGARLEPSPKLPDPPDRD